MVKVLNAKMDKVQVEEAFIINKKTLDGDAIKFTMSRKVDADAESSRKYIGRCEAELKLAAEENLDILKTSFYVKIALTGSFTIDEDEKEITEEKLHTTIFLEMLPHVRACMASMMSSAGMPPYLIPNSIIPELS